MDVSFIKGKRQSLNYKTLKDFENTNIPTSVL